MESKTMIKKIRPEIISPRILTIRGCKVMLDHDLAELYKVPTKRLNEQVKRNISRFPSDFMFLLTKKEKNKVVAICDHLKKLKYSHQLPYAFTEQGIAMLSSVLNSEQAIKVNIAIMRAFVNLRKIIQTHAGLSIKLDALENKYEKHEIEIQEIFEALRQIMKQEEQPRSRIGF
jgi:hypothetical protein